MRNWIKLAVLVLFWLAQPVLAAEIVVDTLVDETESNGQCSIREALANAENDNPGIGDCIAGSGDDVIDLTGLTGVIILSAGQLKVFSNIRFVGSGADNLALDGNSSSRIFYIEIGATVEIDGLTVMGGNADFSGGGIYNGGTVTLTNSTISGNSAEFEGGGIYDEGTVTLTNSTISGNSAEFGSGIGSIGTVTLTNSTISGNSGFLGNSGEFGSVIDSMGDVTLTNSTTIGGDPGFLSVEFSSVIDSMEGDLTLTNSTISGNHGTGIVASSGYLTITNSTISGNSG